MYAEALFFDSVAPSLFYYHLLYSALWLGV